MAGDELLMALHAAAPPKPACGAPCNGCGVCCAAAPCPLSRFLLAHRTGACPALSWQAGEGRYRCGMVVAPEAHLRWLPEIARTPFCRFARRWIAAGAGCDFDAEVSDTITG